MALVSRVLVSCALLAAVLLTGPTAGAPRSLNFYPYAYYPYDRVPGLVKRTYSSYHQPATGRASSSGSWKLPFGKPSFLSSLIDNGEEEATDSSVPASHLLPDYLMHQEFLKPQLQAAGFSGGRIIAGPFPVPLSSLPSPAQVRAGAGGPPLPQQQLQAQPLPQSLAQLLPQQQQHHHQHQQQIQHPPQLHQQPQLQPEPQPQPQPQPQLQLQSKPQKQQPTLNYVPKAVANVPPPPQPQQPSIVKTAQQQIANNLVYSPPTATSTKTLIYNPPPLVPASSPAQTHLVYNPPQPSHLLHGQPQSLHQKQQQQQHHHQQTLLAPYTNPSHPQQKAAHPSASANGHYLVNPAIPLPPPPPPTVTQSRPAAHQKVAVKVPSYTFPSELPSYSKVSTNKAPAYQPAAAAPAVAPSAVVRAPVPTTTYSIAAAPLASYSQIASQPSSSEVRVSYGGWTPIYSPGLPTAPVVDYAPEQPKTLLSQATESEDAIAQEIRVEEDEELAQDDAANEELQNLEFADALADLSAPLGLDGGVSSSIPSNQAEARSSDVVVVLEATEGDESVLAEGRAGNEEEEEEEEEEDEVESASADVSRDASFVEGDDEQYGYIDDESYLYTDQAGQRTAKQDAAFAEAKPVYVQAVSEGQGRALDAQGAGRDEPETTPARGQGRFVGRVLMASVFDSDTPARAEPSPVRWRQIVADYEQQPLTGLPQIGYTLRFNENL